MYNMQRYKLRKVGEYIVTNDTGSKVKNIVMGLTVPQNVAIFFENTKFTITHSGNSIIYTSGCDHVNKKEVENYEFKECRL